MDQGDGRELSTSDETRDQEEEQQYNVYGAHFLCGCVVGVRAL